MRTPRDQPRASAGLKQIRFHDLRQTFGAVAVQVFPLSDVKAYMGHADIARTMVYVHHVPQVDAAERRCPRRLARQRRAAQGEAAAVAAAASSE